MHPKAGYQITSKSQRTLTTVIMMRITTRTAINATKTLVAIDGMVRPPRLSYFKILANIGIARLLQGPGLKWHKEYSDLDQQAGRVLMIDFARSGLPSLPSSLKVIRV
jgi:hypothetical protein